MTSVVLRRYPVSILLFFLSILSINLCTVKAYYFIDVSLCTCMNGRWKEKKKIIVKLVYTSALNTIKKCEFKKRFPGLDNITYTALEFVLLSWFPWHISPAVILQFRDSLFILCNSSPNYYFCVAFQNRIDIHISKHICLWRWTFVIMRWRKFRNND